VKEKHGLTSENTQLFKEPCSRVEIWLLDFKSSDTSGNILEFENNSRF
jgi:hypothetical protein